MAGLGLSSLVQGVLSALGNATVPVGHRASWGPHSPVPGDGGVSKALKKLEEE